MIFSYDKYDRIDRPIVYLANANKRHTGTLVHTSELVTDLCVNDISQATFKIYKSLNGINTSHYDEIEQLELIELSNIGWFQITSVNILRDENNNEYKTVTALSLENELNTKTLTSFGSLGISTDESGGLDRYKLYDITDTAHSILHIVMQKAPSWSVGYIDPSITTLSRAFDNDSVGAYAFLVGDVSEKFECIFQFDTYNRKISAYTINNLGVTTSIYLAYRNLIKKLELNKSADIFTVMRVTGGDDMGTPLGIIETNPVASNYISNFSYYKDKMSTELRIKYEAFEIEYASRVNNFTPAIEYLKTLYADLADIQNRNPSTPHSMQWSDYGLAALNTERNHYNEAMSLAIAKKDETNRIIYYNIIFGTNGINNALNVRQAEYNAKLVQINNQKILAESYTLDLEEYLGVALYKELSNFAHETSFTDSTYIITEDMTDDQKLQAQRDLMVAAHVELEKVCQPSYTMSVDSINFANIPEFRKYANQLKLGNIVTVELDDDKLIDARLLKMHINWDKLNEFELTFSSRDHLDGGWYDFAKVMAENSKATTSSTINGSGWDLAKAVTSDYNTYKKSALDTSLQKLKNGKNETFTVDGTGTLWRKWDDNTNDYSPNQMWGIGNGLYLSGTAWSTVDIAIGELDLGNGVVKYGIAAPLLMGDVILGEYLSIINNSGNFTIKNDTGLTATAIVGGNTYSFGVNPSTPNQIIKVAVNGVSQLYMDTVNRRLVMNGEINATNGTLNNLTVTGTITGGTFQGTTFNGATGNFTGSITATSGNIGGFTIDTTQLTSGSGNKFIRISPYSTTSGTNNYTTAYGSIDLGKSSDGLDTLIHLRSDGYARFGLNSLAGSVRFNHTVTGTDGHPFTYSMYTSGFKITQNGTVYCDWLQSQTKLTLWGDTGLALGSDSTTTIEGSKLHLSVNAALVSDSFTFNDYRIYHAGNSHSHSSYDIIVSETESHNINMSGTQNAASVYYVQETFVRKDASDFRLKKNILTLDFLPDELYMALKPKLFEFKSSDDYKSGKVMGLLAQQVESAFESYGINPFDYNLVEKVPVKSYTNDGLYVDDEVHRLNYDNFISWGIYINQKQQIEIESLKSEMMLIKQKIGI